MIHGLNFRLSIYKNAPGLRRPDPLPGLSPWAPLGDFRPQTPYLSPQFNLLDPPLKTYTVKYYTRLPRLVTLRRRVPRKPPKTLFSVAVFLYYVLMRSRLFVCYSVCICAASRKMLCMDLRKIFTRSICLGPVSRGLHFGDDRD